MRRSSPRPAAASIAAADAALTKTMDSSLNLHLHPRPPPSPKLPPLKTLAGLAVALLLLLLVGVSRSPASLQYSIIIDGGSTGTRVHVFAYRASRGGAVVLDSGSTATMKVTPGLSAYGGRPRGAGASVRELVEFGKGRVPREVWGETEVRLMGTAGLRMVEGEVAERVLEECRRVLRGSGFRFRDDWASVISGSDEGIYAWVAANYALGTLGGDPHKTTGIFELGGASAQVTFVANEPLPPDFLHVVKFGETTYNLYSHSFLHLGQNVAYESLRQLLSLGDPKTSADYIQGRILKDPCTPKGYVHHVEPLKPSIEDLKSKAESYPVAHAVGNFSECKSAALMLLQKAKDECLHPRCLLGSAFIPKLQGRFLATENFFYTSKFFGLGPTSFLGDLMLAGERFCEEDWLTLKKKHHALDDEDLVGDVALDWALGAFIMQKTSSQISSQLDWMPALVDGESSTVFSLLFVFTLLILTAWSLSKWRKPQSKTIFDLEKGRYITVHYRT